MNKVLHAFVYLFLILTGVAFYFTYEIYQDKEELSDRNKMLRRTLKELAIKIEDTSKYKATEAENPANNRESGQDFVMDNASLEAKYSAKYDGLDKEQIPEGDWVNVLAKCANWNFNLEQTGRETLSWGLREDEKLRSIYVIDPATGKPMNDGATKVTDNSEADEFLKGIVNHLTKQNEELKATREAIPSLREELKTLVVDINKVKGECRNALATVFQKNEEIKKLEENVTKLSSEKQDLKSQNDTLKTDIVSLRDEITTCREETEATKEQLAAEKEMVTKLKKMIQDFQKNIVTTTTATSGGASGEMGAVASVTAGDKGKIISADNTAVFAIIEVTPEVMKEIKGNDLNRPLPILDFTVRRPGFNGPAGEIVGRLRLRQEVPGKNWIICDILADWSQDELKKDDIVIAD